MKTKTYGQHLMIDGYGADPEKLASLETIYRLLDELPSLIGMQKIGPPQMAKFDDPKIAGVTGVIMIVTSHISIHTYALKRCFFMDVFSCKEFDAKQVVDFVVHTFNTNTLEISNCPRGNKFPEQNSY